MSTPRLAVLFSGGGRTVLNLIDRIEDGTLDARIDLAIAAREGLIGTQRLVDRGLEVGVARSGDESAETGDRRVCAWLDEARPDLVCLCGYLRLLELADWMHGRVMNIHPALLPRHGGRGMFGMGVHEAVLAAGETETGCSVHFVDDQYDHGPTILQRTCPVHDGDIAADLAERVFALECETYPRAISMVAGGEVRLIDGQAVSSTAS